ncbi:Alkyl sulfatase C-terminal [Amycolatopsis arida]|uniref:Alkyl sulfatase C-terminal n=1 Tax=Amycolatopsis arida TaxID=587909 RepID=A0A1I5TFE2_9PSEU|nr:alkyl sulfatase C-terminal domain-containing protein [Amycolatopsis arida]TDX96125.1 alkyl sulfatase-like protein [Amycolatopsis arida]SFP81407.1 Alkyl sulfatase C-terminal [Amycolatopsis arida]
MTEQAGTGTTDLVARLDVLAREPDTPAESRTRLLDALFDRMAARLRPGRAAAVDAAVCWRFPGGTGDGGFDRYEMVIRDGRCTVGRDLREPRRRVTVTLDPGDLGALLTGGATPVVLFVTGRIRVRGDLAFAAGLLGFFDLPEKG